MSTKTNTTVHTISMGLLLSPAFLVCLFNLALADIAAPSPVIPEEGGNTVLSWEGISYLAEPAMLTVLVELPLFFLAGYRTFRDCFLFACINILTNLLLNQFLDLLSPDRFYVPVVLLSELVVVCLEFALCTFWIRQGYAKLLAVLFLTNITSFLLGLFLYSL